MRIIFALGLSILFASTPASATDKLYKLLAQKPAGAVSNSLAGASASASAAEAPSGSLTRGAKIAFIKKELLAIAQEYRDDFYSTNAFRQSRCNNQWFLLSRKFDTVDSEVWEKTEKLWDSYNTIYKEKSKGFIFKRWIIDASFITKTVLEKHRISSWWFDSRMVANCIGISRVMFSDFYKKFSGSGIKVGIYYFSEYTNTMGHHQFTMLDCGGELYIVDGWRGAGEVYGPLSLDPKTKMLKPIESGDALPDYYEKKIDHQIVVTAGR